jgi:hypothetical protein
MFIIGISNQESSRVRILACGEENDRNVNQRHLSVPKKTYFNKKWKGTS